ARRSNAPKIDAERNNTTAEARSIIRPRSFAPCNFLPDILLTFLPRDRRPSACSRPSISPGWNLLLISTGAPPAVACLRPLLLRLNLLLILLLLNRLLDPFLTPRRALDAPPRARTGVENFFPHCLGVLHFFGDRRRRERGQAPFGDHTLRAIDRD